MAIKSFYKKITAAVFLLIASGMANPATSQLKPAAADSFLNFIKSNKDKASVYITKNDTIIAYLNEYKLMPLASTFKILVAVEFAKQAGSMLINPGSRVALRDLDRYYLPGTDGDAHPNWLMYEKENGLIKNDSVNLVDVAKGMIRFSSNANTEYLMDLLGTENIKSNIRLFGLKIHTSLYPPVASLFMYQNPRKISETKILKAINGFSDEQYSMNIHRLHLQLKRDINFKSRFRPQDLTEKMQKNWSDRLPSSTTKDYIHLANIINNRKFLDDNAYTILAEIMEYPMENKNFQAVFKHYGVKGGSTAFVLTHVVYFTTTNGKTMEMAIFLNNLLPEEEKRLEGQLDPFEAQVIFDASFRKKLNFN
jgi:D-alanyl-D-alanine carboxypeptidase